MPRQDAQDDAGDAGSAPEQDAEAREARADDEAFELEPWDDAEPVQQRLPLDEPVPYRLTTAGRRAVAPEGVPSLRVVDGGHVDLDEQDGTHRVRARALRRAGAHTLDIAEELGVEPLHVEAWVADLPVPPDAGRSRRRRQLRVVRDAGGPSAGELRERWRRAADDGHAEATRRLAAEPGLLSGLGILSGVLEQDHHALVLTGQQLPLLAAAWSWLQATLSVDDDVARALVRHDPGVAGDRVAHEVARSLGVETSAVSTTRDAARVGRDPLVRMRVSDPELSGRVHGWQRALLIEITHGAG